MLTDDPINNLNILISFNKRKEVDIEFSMEISKLDHPGNMTENQYRYRARKVVDILERIKSKDIEVKVMKYWLDQLLSHSVVEAIIESCDVLPPKHFISNTFSVSQAASQLSKEYLSYSTSKSPLEIRSNSIKFLIEVTKACK